MTRTPEARAGVASMDLAGTSALVTGSTDGIGREAAQSLGRLGARVLVHGRSRDKADRVVDAIESTGGTAEAYLADFCELAAVRELARAVRADVETLDLLVNNAAAYFDEGRRTAAGVEATMAVNHLAPFLLTHRLAPMIPADGRIVTTASEAHRGASLDPGRIDEIESYRGFRAYSRSKLANILFTRELDRRLDGPTTACVHPGFVPGSGLWRNAPRPVRWLMRGVGALPDRLTEVVAATPRSGAATLVYLATAPDVSDHPGRYYAEREPTEPSPAARDDDLAAQLWSVSEDRTELAPDYRLD